MLQCSGDSSARHPSIAQCMPLGLSFGLCDGTKEKTTKPRCTPLFHPPLEEKSCNGKCCVHSPLTANAAFFSRTAIRAFFMQFSWRLLAVGSPNNHPLHNDDGRVAKANKCFAQQLFIHHTIDISISLEVNTAHKKRRRLVDVELAPWDNYATTRRHIKRRRVNL